MNPEIKRRKYTKSPVVECLCEIEFGDSQPKQTQWDNFYTEISEKYPTKKIGERIKLVNKDSEPTEVVKEESVNFINEKKTEAITIAENFLAFNQLKRPYKGFEAFRKNFEYAINKYKKIYMPVGFSQLRLRYVNIIEIPTKEVILDEYFTYFPKTDEVLLDFQLEYSLEPFHKNHFVFVILGTLHPKSNIHTFLLVVEDVFSRNNEADSDFILKALNEAHENIGRTFEKIITTKTRNLFEEVKDGECNW